ADRHGQPHHCGHGAAAGDRVDDVAGEHRVEHADARGEDGEDEEDDELVLVPRRVCADPAVDARLDGRLRRLLVLDRGVHHTVRGGHTHSRSLSGAEATEPARVSAVSMRGSPASGRRCRLVTFRWGQQHCTLCNCFRSETISTPPGESAHSLRSWTFRMVWSADVWSTRSARPRLGWTFSLRFGRLMESQISVARV